MTDKNLVTAAFIIIGNEILSGRTVDKNLNFLALELTALGVNLMEVRVVPDDESEIVEAVNQLRSKFDYVFTSGGIGPTHDDITSASIAKAFNDQLIKHKKAEQILISHYGKKNVNKARMKMAYIPSKAKLLDNPISSAPGFIVENVIVMAGIPAIMQTMFADAKQYLKTGSKTISKELKLSLTESVIADDLENLQQKFNNVAMGSYPFKGGTSLVFRSTDKQNLEKSFNEMLSLINSKHKNAVIDIS